MPTFYAQYDIDYATVTWNAQGGTASEPSRHVQKGKPVGTLPTCTRSGYTFNGWYTAASGGSKISASTVVNNNVTYYAHLTNNIPDIKWVNGSVAPFSSAKVEFSFAIDNRSKRNWVVPSGVKTIKVTAVGAGGRGRPSAVQNYCYPSGSGGEIVENVLIDVTPGETLTIITQFSSDSGLGETQITRGDTILLSANPGNDAVTPGVAPAGPSGAGRGGNYDSSRNYIAPTNGKYGKAGKEYIEDISRNGKHAGGGGSWGDGETYKDSAGNYRIIGIGGGIGISSASNGAIFINY